MGYAMKILRVFLLVLVFCLERSLPLAVQNRDCPPLFKSNQIGSDGKHFTCPMICATSADCGYGETCLCYKECGNGCYSSGQMCNAPTTPLHAYIKPMNTKWRVGSTVMFLCQKGYFRHGSGPVSLCEANGTWSESHVLCIARSCGGPGTPLNGKKQGLLYQLGDTVHFTCGKGYRLIGSSRRTCTLLNHTMRVEWSGIQPLCKPVSCGNVAKVAHGQTLVGMTTYQSKVFYTCNKGYKLEGSSVLTCGEDGKWLETEPSCKEIECEDPGLLQNGFQEGSDLGYGAEVRYMCRRGYVIFGSPTRTCSEEGQWTGVKPFCVECAKVGTAVLIRKGNNFLPAIVLEKRFFVVTVQRQDTGDRERILTLGPGTQHYAIVEDKIPNPHDIINGSKVIAMNSRKGVHMFATVTKHIKKDIIVFRVLFADNTTAFVALEFLRTLEPPIFCALCDDPGTPDHAISPDDLREFISGMEVTYTCEHSYRISGPGRRTCLPDGQWSGAPPICTVAACDELEVVSPSNGLRNGNDFSLGGVVNFTCDEGYAVHGEMSLRCSDNGKWSGSAPTCKHVCELQNIRCQAWEKCLYAANLGPKCVCRENIECTALYSPVCGSDGTTYNNHCIMKATACRQARQIQQVKHGHCAPVDVCASHMEPGPCANNETRWAFDPTSRRCVKFKYGGCFGNENNFRTKQSCREKCIKKGRCPRCPHVDLNTACQNSSFALLVQVNSALAPETTKRLLRYEAKIRKIFLDTAKTISEGDAIVSVTYGGPSNCSCPRLPIGKMFLIVGRSPNELITVTAKTGLTVASGSYVRGWTNKAGAQLRKRCAATLTNLS